MAMNGMLRCRLALVFVALAVSALAGCGSFQVVRLFDGPPKRAREVAKRCSYV